MSTKSRMAELFESVHGRKPSPRILDAKAAALIRVPWLLKQHL